MNWKYPEYVNRGNFRTYNSDDVGALAGKLSKAEVAFVEGEWTDNDGNKRYATEIVADEINFVDSKSESGAPANVGTRAPASADNTDPAPDVDGGEPTSDLPF